ncbi:hypothetical protein ACQP00_29145 [Dactylosporangium sp. CS-047395]|uniref:hypothetical protein n=1 Tax=Dactylosporangium sp. CS-047395 TaxID=3239936 RepID=UPI003D89F12F
MSFGTQSPPPFPTVSGGPVVVGSMIDVSVTSGSIREGRIEMTHATIPADVDPASLEIYVYDNNAKLWAPLTGTEVGADGKEVAAEAPHFSWFATVGFSINGTGRFWFPLPAFPPKTVFWKGFTDAFDAVVVDTAKKLLGIPQELTCDGKMDKYVVIGETTPSGMLDGCVVSEGEKRKIKLRNKFAFPVVVRMPDGLVVDPGELGKGTDIVEVFRNALMMWLSHSIAINGGGIVTLDISKDAKLPAELTGHLEWATFAYDMAVYALTMLLPEAEGLEASALRRMNENVPPAGDLLSDKIVHQASDPSINNQIDVAQLSALAEVILKGIEVLGCVATNLTAAIDYHEQSVEKWLATSRSLANIATNCVVKALGEIYRGNIEKVARIFDVVKYAPEEMQARLALATKAVTNLDPTKMKVSIGRSFTDFGGEATRICLQARHGYDGSHQSTQGVEGTVWESKQALADYAAMLRSLRSQLAGVEQPAGSHPLDGLYSFFDERAKQFDRFVEQFDTLGINAINADITDGRSAPRLPADVREMGLSAAMGSGVCLNV